MTGPERGWLLLCSHLGDPDRRPLSPAQLRRLASRLRSAERSTGDRDLEARDLTALGYSLSDAQRILQLLSQEEQLDWYLVRARKSGCVPITRATGGYPRLLLRRLGDDAPGCLWARGDATILNRPGIALVGSRDLNPENAAFARKTGAEAARQGLTLISGNARGADRTAQNAALAAGGQVISLLADCLTDHAPPENMLCLSEEDFDAEFSAQRALSRNRCIHALGNIAIAAQLSLRTGGTWDGSVKNLRFGWSPLYVFDDGSESAQLMEQMGATPIHAVDLEDLTNLPTPAQQTL